MKTASFIFFALFFFFALTCKKEPPVVPPPPSRPDTTNHSFTFTQYEFGTSPGYFRDCAIINDSDIWCVGAVNEGTDTMYNAVHWDGRTWSLIKISANFRGNFITAPMEGIFAFSSTDIWLAASDPIHGDGQNWVDYDIRSIPGYDSLSVSKCWGTTSNMMYFVGRGGSIIRYNSATWTKQESGTTIDLHDVWGTTDGSVVWACGYSNDNSQSILLRYDGVDWKTTWAEGTTTTHPYGDLVTSLWGIQHLFTSTNFGVYRQNISGTDTAQQILAINHFPYRIRGSAENNIAVVGDDGMIWHYNGASWKLLNEVGSGVPLYSVAVSEDMIVAVGADFNVTDIFPPKALVYLGRRTE